MLMSLARSHCLLHSPSYYIRPVANHSDHINTPKDMAIT